MNEIIFNLHIDGKTVFNIAFYGTLGVAAAKGTIKLVKNITKKQNINTDIFND